LLWLIKQAGTMALKQHADCLMLVATENCLGFLSVDLYLTH